MVSRTRWFAEIANIFLLWAEEWPDNNPPWKAYIQFGPRTTFAKNTAGDFIEVKIHSRETFVARSKQIALDAIETTIRNSSEYQGYAHRLADIKWQQCDVSDEDWGLQRERFTRGEGVEVHIITE